METTIQLNTELLNTDFLNNFIECCLVKPHITPTSGNTQLGHGLWKSGYKYALRQYITDHVDGLNKLPSGVHRIESPPLSRGSSKNILNIVKFPNISPYIGIKKGKAILLNRYPHKSDAGCFGKKDKEWGRAPTKYRSLRFLREDQYWPHRAPIEYLYLLQQHTKISDETLLYLSQLVLSFLKVHQFPPNLVLLRELIKKLPKSRRATSQARELVRAINQLDEESRARSVFQKVDYVVQKSSFVRYSPPNSKWNGWDNICLIPDKEKYDAIYKTANEDVFPDVYALEFTHQVQRYSPVFEHP